MISTVHLFTTHHVACIEVAGKSHLTFANLEAESRSLRVHISKLLSCEVTHNALHLLSLLLWSIITRIFFTFRQIFFLHFRGL